MKCECGIDARVESGGITKHEGVQYEVQTFVCRNPQCKHCNKIIGAVSHELKPTLKTKMCCGYIIEVNGQICGSGICPKCKTDYKKGGEQVE
jgi:hypothetical protein